ncbi:MAG: hypothetical protein COB20_05940 [SAR86 cluster bacterium]|uniref:Uncharacterized protein n=1 Tax=SAR86 cluster bacterium TaxID=2030880 RepID=A0A2A4X8S4_9GAMM|nr:MAG: hypothetical protein COB20_05940 [SAR86 cluster bacterium]
MKKILLIATLLSIPFLVSAHHSTNANFTQEIISVEGIIERVRFQNPHASVLINNTNAQGEETFWLIESASRTTLQRQGVSLDILEIGAKVKATGRKGRREFTMYLREIEFEDGTVFVPQPDLN